MDTGFFAHSSVQVSTTPEDTVGVDAVNPHLSHKTTCLPACCAEIIAKYNKLG